MVFLGKNCIQLNSINDTTDWILNSSVRPINVFPITVPPYLNYDVSEVKSGNQSILYYQFCGALVVLIKAFAKQMNVNLKVDNQDDNMYELLISMSDWFRFEKFPDIVLFPYVDMNFVDLLIENNLSDIILTRFVGQMDGNVILSKTFKNVWPLMSYLDCFDNRIYLGFLLFLFIISMIIALKYWSVKAFVSSFWIYSSLFLSKQFKLRSKDWTDISLASVWIMSSVVILAYFSGSLYDKLMMGQPIETINSMEQLLDEKSHWSKSKAFLILGVGESGSLLDDFMGNESSAEILLKRSEAIDPMELLFNSSVGKRVFESIVDENNVISINRLHAYYLLNSIHTTNPEVMSKYTDGIDYYISDTKVTKSYFLMTYFNDIFDENSLNSLNEIISRLQESGNYEYEIQKTLGNDYFNKMEVQSNQDLENMTIAKLKGVFETILFSYSISLILFIIELNFSRFWP